MDKKILTTAFAAVAFSLSANAYATEAQGDMEKCKVVNGAGKGLIKEHKADCAAKNASCAGHNSAGDPEAWILVPAGECAKINKGDYIGVSKEIMDKLDVEQPKK